MVKVTEAELAAADAAGKRMLADAPLAASARFDSGTGRIVIELINGCSYAFPAHLAEDLKDATPNDLTGLEIDGDGLNLRIPALDADLFVPALVTGIFGTRAWMGRELARQAGRTSSSAKAAAARSNGAKGGRPRKAASA